MAVVQQHMPLPVLQNIFHLRIVAAVAFVCTFVCGIKITALNLWPSFQIGWHFGCCSTSVLDSLRTMTYMMVTYFKQKESYLRDLPLYFPGAVYSHV